MGDSLTDNHNYELYNDTMSFPCIKNCAIPFPDIEQLNYVASLSSVRKQL